MDIAVLPACSISEMKFIVVIKAEVLACDLQSELVVMALNVEVIIQSARKTNSIFVA